MASKKETTQVQTRSGLEHKTGYRTGITYDPFHLAIVAPAPPADLKILIEVFNDNGTSKTYTFGKKDVVGPYDRFEPGLGWEQTFQWAQQPRAAARVQEHVIAFLDGADNKEIFCQHTKGQAVPIVIDGRHSVLAERLANLIRSRTGRDTRYVGFVTRSLTEAQAATAARVRNYRYDRDNAAEIAQNVYEINVNGWPLDVAAKKYGVTVQTIRAWIKRSTEPSIGAPEPSRRARKTPTKSEAQAAYDRARKSSAPGAEEWAKVCEWFATGQVPADPELRRIVTGK